jgi:hypothetical protein
VGIWFVFISVQPSTCSMRYIIYNNFSGGQRAPFGKKRVCKHLCADHHFDPNCNTLPLLIFTTIVHWYNTWFTCVIYS